MTATTNSPRPIHRPVQPFLRRANKDQQRRLITLTNFTFQARIGKGPKQLLKLCDRLRLIWLWRDNTLGSPFSSPDRVSNHIFGGG